ncbi:hypothetical protein, variant [Verruconis gallopava]|uniref:Heterokaryon incompatibility domain-containing protein n=1 Tax=Verruconis gallopava TaxID=253628 RepID=A0A0D1Z579_9PEZI|nr:hypothetical protein, variant [Verruconis gallopava]KIW08137.1 hypothetical protein, variant [Verruconis gallopava]
MARATSGSTLCVSTRPTTPKDRGRYVLWATSTTTPGASWSGLETTTRNNKSNDESWDAYAKRLQKHSPTDEKHLQDLLDLKPMGGDWLQLWDRFLRFIQRKRWFRRCWILQEYALAKGVVYLCGESRVGDHLHLLMYLGEWITNLEEIQDCSYNLSPTVHLFSVANEYIRPFASRPGCFANFSADPEPERSATEVAMQYLSSLLQWTRERECAFDADRVFSVLGVVCRLLGPSKVLHPGVEDLLDRQSPEQVFTWAASAYANTVSYTDMLANVEPRGDRKLVDLPSWVPDFSVGIAVFPVSLTGCDATLTGTTAFERPRVRGSTLTLGARYVDVVVEAYPACLSIALLSMWGDALNSMIIDALKECDTFMDGMSLKDVGASIESGLQLMWPTFNTKGRLTKQGLSKAMAMLDEIGQDQAALNALVLFFCKWTVLLNNAYNKTLSHEEMYRIIMLLDYRAAGGANVDRDRCVFARSLFRTSKPYAGLGPASMQPGDTLWLLEGGKAAYVLRENKGQGTFTLIGECYGLGIMDGQLMEPERDASFISIDLV